jgi:quercetin dioxygenase-like cupin family protein
MSSVTDQENRRVDSLLGAPRPPLDADITGPADLADLRVRWAGIASVPVIAAERSDGIDHSWAGVDVRTLLRGEQSSGRFAVHNIELAPGAGLAAHYFQDVHAYVLVIAGEVELGVGELVDLARQHSLAYAPPLTRISFRNRSGEPAQLVAVYSPAGAERAFGAAHQHWTATGDSDEKSYRDILSRYGFQFDTTPLPNDSRVNEAQQDVEFEFIGGDDLEKLRAAFAVRPPLPRLIHTVAGDEATEKPTRSRQLLRGDDSGGNAMINFVTEAPGLGAPPHHQPTEEELFFITDNLLDLSCATERLSLGPGAFAFCPRNCTHGFVNATEAPTRFVTLNSPAGHERTMLAVRARAAQGASKEEIHAMSVAGGFVFHSVKDLG